MKYERKSRPAGNEAAPSESSDNQTWCDSISVAAQLRRRRAASKRMVALDCGCPTGPHSDPLTCRCTFPPLTENQLDGWRDAAKHVLAIGETPVVPIEIRRALWRRPADRELAELLHDACGGAVA